MHVSFLRGCLKHLLERREQGNELIPLGQALLHGLLGDVALRPLGQRRVRFVREQGRRPADLLHDPEPVSERAGGDVDEADGVAPEEGPPLELRLQERQVPLRLRQEALLRLAVRREVGTSRTALGTALSIMFQQVATRQ